MAILKIKQGMRLNGGQYVVDHQLRIEANAVVWAARDTLTREMIALKVLQSGADKATRKALMKEAQDEVKIICEVHHKHILKLLNVFVEKKCLIYVWELFSGLDLPKYLGTLFETRMPEDMAGFFFYQLLFAVKFLHKQGISNLNIKPKKCMICMDTMRLKLAPFSLPRGSNSGFDIGCGTPYFIPPGFLDSPTMRNDGSDSAADGHAADTWALGMILYTMVCGDFRFENPEYRSAGITIQNIYTGRRHRIPSYITQGCANLMEGLLQPYPEDRMSLDEVCCDRWVLKSAAAYFFRTQIMKMEIKSEAGLGGADDSQLVLTPRYLE